jgi:hypothetical protein
MSSGMTPLKRFVVRTTLVVGSTVATIIGAETLATVDVKSTATPLAIPPTTIPIQPTAVSAKAAVVNAAPTIVIIRHAPVQQTQGAQSPVTANTTVVQPPQPVAVQPRPQIIVQAAAPSQPQASVVQLPPQPMTQSTR